MSANTMPQVGPMTMWVNSTTRKPSSGCGAVDGVWLAGVCMVGWAVKKTRGIPQGLHCKRWRQSWRGLAGGRINIHKLPAKMSQIKRYLSNQYRIKYRIKFSYGKTPCCFV
jgi:hypothetical protein